MMKNKKVYKSENSNCDMKKGMKVFSVILLSLILVSIIAGVVSARTVIGELFNQIPGNLNLDIKFLSDGVNFTDHAGFARILMFLLVFIIIYAVSEFLPFVGGNKYLAPAFSIVVALLSTLFLSRQEVYTSLLAYNALGIAVTAVIPFIAITIISKKLFEGGHLLWSRLLWIAFIVFLIFRWAFADITELGAFGTFAYPIVFILTLIMVFFQKWIFRKMFEQELIGSTEKYKTLNSVQLSGEINRLEQLKQFVDKDNVKEIEDRQKYLDKLMKA